MNLRLQPLLFALLALLLSAPAFAQSPQQGEVFITAEAARSLHRPSFVDAREAGEVAQKSIPGAVNLPWHLFVDGEQSGKISDDDARLERILRQAGISNANPVVIFGNWSADHAWGEEGRLFWMLEYLGHEHVYILQGGLNAWEEADLPVTRATQTIGARFVGNFRTGDFQIRRRDALRITTEELAQALQSDAPPILLDTRERVEFTGTIKYGESRPGHIPGAHHLWWADLFDASGELKSPSQIEAMLRHRGIDRRTPIIAYCTGGIRSGFVYAVLRSIGFNQVKNYDASMWSWTADPDAPLTTQ